MNRPANPADDQALQGVYRGIVLPKAPGVAHA